MTIRGGFLNLAAIRARLARLFTAFRRIGLARPGRSAWEPAHADAELFLSYVPSILIGLDAEGRVTRWNTAAADILGVSAKRAVGHTLDDCGIHWLKPEIREDVKRWLRSAVPSYRSEDLPYHRDGKQRSLGLSVRRIARQGRTAGFIVTAADVTEGRALERELRQAHRLEAVGQLAAGIAHEINTPIQFVCDNLQFLRRAFETWRLVLGEYEKLRRAAAAGQPAAEPLAALARALEEADMDYLSQETPKALAQSLDGMQRVATIVRAMKEFAHPGRREKEAADLNRALENALTVVHNEIKEVADVHTDFGALPPVVCRLAEINQVFLNLLLNAGHAVRETKKRGQIAVRTRQEGDHVAITISDTGCGIPPDIRSKVFDPFFTTKPVGRGSGQGLSIARSIVVERHGGILTFEPNGAQGTTFHIRLPLAAVVVAED